MIQTINRLVTIIISIFYLFTIKMEYFVNENLHISYEQLPTLMPKCALIEVKTEDYSEIFFLNSLFFSLSFFFFVFLLTCFISSNCLARYTIYFLVLFEFFLTRYICFFFIHLDTQLILIRFLRFLSVSISIFLLFFCYKCNARRRLYQQKPKTKRRKTTHKGFHNFADLLTGIFFL